MSLIYIGIDNGVQSGGLCAMNEDGLIIDTATMPFINLTERKNAIGKKEVNIKLLHLWISETVGDNLSNGVYILEEPRGSQSATACASMFGCFHAIRGFFDAKFLRWHRVYPSEWQREMLPIAESKDESTKSRALRKAKELHPDFHFPTLGKTKRSKKVHDGIVDACLIAEWARMEEL